MIWTPEIVRARFVEACDTERRTPTRMFASGSGYWPAYVHSFEDMVGWGAKRLAEEREMRFARIPPSASAISRHSEVMEWSMTILTDEKVRRIVWAWAWCKAEGRSFSAHCDREGWVKATAYRRRDKALSAIASDLGMRGVLVRLPDDKWLRQELPDMASVSCTLDDLPNDRSGIRAWNDGSISADQPDIRDFSWAQHQAERRAKIEAKKRRKLGLEPAPAGA